MFPAETPEHLSLLLNQFDNNIHSVVGELLDSSSTHMKSAFEGPYSHETMLSTELLHQSFSSSIGLNIGNNNSITDSHYLAPSTKVLTQDCQTRDVDTKSAQMLLKDLC